jgi:hypothetical protein
MTADGSAPKSLLRAPEKHTSGDPSAEGQGPTTRDADRLAPLWGTYILRAPYWSSTFDRLRPVFVASAQLLNPTDDLPRGWSFTEHFSQYAIAALLNGQLAVSDPDGLLESTFGRVSVSDRVQSYWLIWRHITDASEQPLGAIAQRVLAFWQWRVESLEVVVDGSDRVEEAKGLTWLILTNGLPAAMALPLACRTLKLSGGTLAADVKFWKRAEEFAAVDAVAVLDVIEPVIRAQLRTGYPTLPTVEVGGVFSLVLRSGNRSAIERATRMIHYLGEQGYEAFGALLEGDDAPGSSA